MDRNGKVALFFISLLVVLLATGLVMAGKGKAGGKPECRDKKDNDGDGLIDYPKDPGCSSKKDRDESDEPVVVCGNNVREGSEVCDGTDLGGETCVSRGFDGGSLECASDCKSFVTSGCFDNTCSDTDGGIVSMVRGTVSGDFEGNSYSETDFCLDTTSVLEFYCSEDVALNMTLECVGNATVTCLNGACI